MASMGFHKTYSIQGCLCMNYQCLQIWLDSPMVGCCYWDVPQCSMNGKLLINRDTKVLISLIINLSPIKINSLKWPEPIRYLYGTITSSKISEKSYSGFWELQKQCLEPKTFDVLEQFTHSMQQVIPPPLFKKWLPL